MSIKIKYISFLLLLFCLAFTFAPKQKVEENSAWIYTHLVAAHRFEEAAILFKKLARKTNEKKYVEASEILKNTPSDLLDYNQFYHTFVSNKNSIFNIDFFSKNNIFTEKETELGALLFFDPVLSANEKRTCASCHRPEKAFCDQRKTSKGFDFSQNLTKNSPTLLNVGFQSVFFHESTAKNLGEVIESVIEHPQEFNNSYEVILKKLNASTDYCNLLKATYGTHIWTKTTLNRAIESYVRSLTAYESPFDKMMSNKNEKKEEQLITGFNTFMGVGVCGKCHKPPSFGGTSLPFFQEHLSFEVNEKKIKVPSLRNISMTMPYMYDGRVATLDEIYGDEVHKQFVENTLNKEQINQINFFLSSLCDSSIVTKKIPSQLPFIASSLRRTVGGFY